MRDTVGRAESVAHRVRQAQAAFGVLAEEAKRGKGREEEVCRCLGVVRVRGVRFGKVREQVRDGLQGELFAGYFGRSWVVEQLHGVVQAADRGREPEAFGRVRAEGGVVEDH